MTYLNQSEEDDKAEHDARLCPQEIVAYLRPRILSQRGAETSRRAGRRKCAVICDAGGLCRRVAYSGEDRKGGGDADDGEGEEGGNADIGVVEAYGFDSNGDDAEDLPEKCDKGEYCNDDLCKRGDYALAGDDGMGSEGEYAEEEGHEGDFEDDGVGTDIDERYGAAAKFEALSTAHGGAR